MILTQASPSYLKTFKKYVKNNRQRAETLKKIIVLFKQNPRHPSLHIEKLSGSDIWTMRINQGDRLFFVWHTKDRIILIDVGSHDKYKNY